ncbi:DUF4136 domain-containing protein [Pontibacter sp. G13]|uniref:DUF4136 domain-containing protein n=1 Tax=Pontibacter sp. G13 TaxID=3074898 RepID=UPI00288AE2D6|nr:DUF4136 domain-containing protein [Pontibacter sp. G13]WNJ19530.1 DUF4136 domain-containing protein [Pontibacter sp. G13]
MSSTRRLVCLTGIAAFALMMVAGCYPGLDRSLTDYDLVGTRYDPDINFDDLISYEIADSVVFIEDGESSELDQRTQDRILDRVNTNMQNLGWTLDRDPNVAADVVMLVSVVRLTNSSWWIDYPWWGWWGWYPGWPPGWGPGWGPGYGWGVPIVYTYETGTIVVEMISVNDADENSQTVPLAWAGAGNGLLSNSDQASLDRVLTAIDAMFEQSPILIK